jgi:hypothetical protein
MVRIYREVKEQPTGEKKPVQYVLDAREEDFFRTSISPDTLADRYQLLMVEVSPLFKRPAYSDFELPAPLSPIASDSDFLTVKEIAEFEKELTNILSESIEKEQKKLDFVKGWNQHD